MSNQDFISIDKYQLFVKLFHKCCYNSDTGKESVHISVLQNFISEQNKEVAVAIDEKEVEQCLNMMVVENKVMIDTLSCTLLKSD